MVGLLSYVTLGTIIWNYELIAILYIQSSVIEVMVGRRYCSLNSVDSLLLESNSTRHLCRYVSCEIMKAEHARP